MNGCGRPRLPHDPEQEPRRLQYRRSKLRQNERRRHNQGICLREKGRLCQILDGTADPEPPTVIRTELHSKALGHRILVETSDGRRLHYRAGGIL